MITEQTLWPVVKLGDVITDMQPGFAQRPQPDDDGVPQLRTNNISNSGTIDLSEVKYVRPSKAEQEKYAVRQGDVIFNNTNSPKLVGRAAYFDLETQFVLSNHMTRLRVIAELLDAEFLSRYLHYLWQVGASLRWAKQWVNQAAIDQVALESFPVPLPPLVEQRRIVTILRQAEEILQLRRLANARAKHLPNAFLDLMLGDFGKYEHQSLFKLCGFITKGTTPKALEIREVPREGDVPFIKVLHITDEGDIAFDREPAFVSRELHEGLLARSKVLPGDIVINIVGPPLGRIALVPERFNEWNVNQALAILRPKQGVDSHYLFHIIRHPRVLPYLLKLAVGVRQLNLSLAQVRTYEIPVPSPDIRSSFEIQARRIRGLREQGELSEGRAKLLSDSLLAIAFTGKLTAKWRDSHGDVLTEAVAERDRQLGIVHDMQPRTMELESEQIDFKRLLGNLSAVFEEVAGTQTLIQQMAQVNLPMPDLPDFSALGDALRPAIFLMADVVNSAITKQIAAINTGILESMVRMTQPLSDIMRRQQSYYADFLEKLAQIARIELDEPLTRAEIEAEVLQTAAELPRYFTMHDIASDWRLNHFDRHAIQEAVEMMVVLGRLRQAKLKMETADPQRPYDLVDAYAVVNETDLVTAGDIEL